MENKFKCFDILDMVIQEATERFKPIFNIDNDDYKVLKQYCEVIDRVIEIGSFESFEVNVDEITMEISIIIERSDMILDNDDELSYLIYELFKRTNTVQVLENDGLLGIEMVFPPIWKE